MIGDGAGDMGALEEKRFLSAIASFAGGDMNRPIVFAILLAGFAAPALAQEYPAKQVRVVLPFPAGGGSDLIARVVAQKLTGSLGQPVVVDNSAGASGNIAAEGDVTAKGKVNASAFVANGVPLNVPDHVLHSDYPLMPIDELRTFVEREHHLPNVPNAEQVRREGVDLARFQMLLLEKVEELTRYLLVQQATIDEQRSRLEALEQRFSSQRSSD